MNAEDIYMIRYAVLERLNLNPDGPDRRAELKGLAEFLLDDLLPGATLEQVLPELAGVETPEPVCV